MRELPSGIVALLATGYGDTQSARRLASAIVESQAFGIFTHETVNLEVRGHVAVKLCCVKNSLGARK